MNQTVYVKIPSNNIHLHRNEREMLNRSRPGPGAAEQAIERSLSRREIELESLLFQQVAATRSGRRLGGDSSHVAGKPGL